MFARNARFAGPAVSSGAAASISRSRSPSMVAARRPAPRSSTAAASSANVSCGRPAAMRLFAAVQRAQHFVGDVDACAEINGILDDEVVFFLLGQLAHDLLRPLQQGLQLFVATLIQILAELALPLLEVAIHVGEFALAARAVGFGEHRAVLFEASRGLLQLRA